MEPSFPDGFLCGTATAAHQVEGNNTNSDFWELENMPGSFFKEPSLDACDHYRRYREDIRTLAGLGFNAYRFSIEWSRVEPEVDVFSHAALAHYRDVLRTCHEYGLTPFVTLHHFTSPRWLTGLGGWAGGETPRRFAAYCEVVMRELGALIPYTCTINEANVGVIIRHRGWNIDGLPARDFLFGSDPRLVVAAHARARHTIRQVSPSTRVGWTLALQDVQAAPGGERTARRMWDEQLGDYLPACEGDDFLGVQTYTRVVVGPEGVLPPPDDAELTQLGYEFYPEGLEHVIRTVAAATGSTVAAATGSTVAAATGSTVAAATGMCVIVTENGVATDDDRRRVDFIRTSLAGVRRCLEDGLDVRGYFHWSALDNFEWMAGYEPRFGLIAVDRPSQRRHIKASARYLGGIAGRIRPAR